MSVKGLCKKEAYVTGERWFIYISTYKYINMHPRDV